MADSEIQNLHKLNGLWMKLIKAQNFASQGKHTFKLKKKGSDFFLSQGHFKRNNKSFISPM